MVSAKDRASVRRNVKRLQRALGLTNFSIVHRFGIKRHCLAETKGTSHKEESIIWWHPPFFNCDDDEKRWAATHELCHVAIMPLTEYCCRVFKRHSSPMHYQALEDEMTEYEEVAVNRLANALAPLLPPWE